MVCEPGDTKDIIMSEEPFSVGNHSIDYDDSDEFPNGTLTPAFRKAFSVMFYRYMFIVMYSVIFVVCIVGNTLVLIVTSRSARMKTRTNFFLANLAVADLCVGVLCILPNLQTYLYFSWLLGTAMCKVYYFTESFSLCASVLFLAVIAIERYIVVMHPLRAKNLFTTCRMHAAQITIWVISAVYNIPLLIIFDTFVVSSETGEDIMFCNIRSDIINLRLYFTVNFVIWYAVPLIIMSVVYAIISLTLWHSGAIFSHQNNVDTISKASSTRMPPMERDQRLLCNPSSSNSYSDPAGHNSGGESSHCDSGGSNGCDLCRINSVNSNGRCCVSYTDITDHFHMNTIDDLGRTPPGQGVFRNNMCDIVQPMLSSCDYGNTLFRYSSNIDTRRGDDVRQISKSQFSTRISCDRSHKNNSLEMSYLTSPCLQYQRTPHKRTSGVSNSTLPTVHPKRRSTRRQSFQSDTDSSPGQTSTFDTNVKRYQQSTSFRVLSSRRKVVRLLVLVLLTFAVCVLPHHVRLLMFYWNVYPVTSFGFTFFPPVAFICMYLNSALNPLLYSLFSESFRRSLRECTRRTCQRGKTLITRAVTLLCRRRR